MSTARLDRKSELTPELWKLCVKIFDQALGLGPKEQPGFIEERCAGNEPVRREVERLLRVAGRATTFMETPAFENAPELLVDNPDALVGEKVGHYQIDAVLGVGGMGVVYLARDIRLDRKVGLKLLPQSFVLNVTQFEHLTHEARTASALNHPNVVTIHDIGEANGVHYVATEFIDGITLRERIRRGPMAVNVALDIVLQISRALCVAHQAGVVHCDLKPENIMLRPDGYVKVLDFGIARFAYAESSTRKAKEVVIGTARYMSPEQVQGCALDARTDIWSLGVVFYEMIAGQPPFQGETATAAKESVLAKDPPPLDRSIPSGISRAISRMLAKAPEARIQSASDLIVELERLQNALRKNQRGVQLAAAAVLIALIIITGYFRISRPGHSPSPARRVASREPPVSTSDGVAYALFTKAQQIQNWENWQGAENSLNQQIDLLQKAVQRDPKFVLAYCALAKAHAELAGMGEAGRSHLAPAKAAAESALRIEPDSGEGHLALARYYWRSGTGPDDFNAALRELAVAEKTLHDNPELLMLRAMLRRHRGQWSEAVETLRRASDLDPSNKEIAFTLSMVYLDARRISDLDQWIATLDGADTLEGPWRKMLLAWARLNAGDAGRAQTLLDQIPFDFSPTPAIWDIRLAAALYRRDFDAAKRVLHAGPTKWADPTAFGEVADGCADRQAALVSIDRADAISRFRAAREKLERGSRDRSDDPFYFGMAAVLDAWLGESEKAVREAEQSTKLLPMSEDTLNGAIVLTDAARAYALAGHSSRALDALSTVATLPGGPSYGDLLLSPYWDNLRGDPRFERIIAAAKAETR
jgi:serine/threonine protein kinase